MRLGEVEQRANIQSTVPDSSTKHAWYVAGIFLPGMLLRTRDQLLHIVGDGGYIGDVGMEPGRGLECQG